MDPTLQNPQVQQLIAALSGQGSTQGATPAVPPATPAMGAAGAIADQNQQASLGNGTNAYNAVFNQPPAAPMMTPPPAPIY